MSARSLEPTKIKKIVVRAPNWVGDVVMSLPFFAQLRDIFLYAEISCLVKSHLAELYQHQPFISRVIPLAERANRLAVIFKTSQEIRRKKFDLAICLPNSFSSAMIFFLAGIPRRVGYAAEGRGLLLTDRFPYLPDKKMIHQSEIYTNLLRAFGFQSDSDYLPVLTAPPSVQKEVDRLFEKHRFTQKQRLAVIAPGSRAPARQWFPNRFAKLADRLIAEGQTVLFVGGPADVPTAVEVKAKMKQKPIDLSGQTSLLGLAEVCRRSRVFIGNDSGAAHVAAAAGTHVVVITGPGDPEQITPLTNRKTVLFHKIFCSHCRKNHCWRSDLPQECLRLISVDEVLETVWPILESTKVPQKIPAG